MLSALDLGVRLATEEKSAAQFPKRPTHDTPKYSPSIGGSKSRQSGEKTNLLGNFWRDITLPPASAMRRTTSIDDNMSISGLDFDKGLNVAYY